MSYTDMNQLWIYMYSPSRSPFPPPSPPDPSGSSEVTRPQHLSQNSYILNSSQSVSLSVTSVSLQPQGLNPARILCPWNSPSKNTGVGCHSLLHGILWAQGSNSGLLHCRQIIVWIPRENESEIEVAQMCPTLCDPVDCSLPGSSIHGILQARVLEWVAISFSRGSSRARDQTQVSRIAGRHFNLWATREAPLNSRKQANLLSVFFSISYQSIAKLLIEYRHWMIKDKKEEKGKGSAIYIVLFLRYSRSEHQSRQQSFHPILKAPLSFLPSSRFWWKGVCSYWHFANMPKKLLTITSASTGITDI